MREPRTGIAGVLLVVAALLVGSTALWSVTGQASGQDDEARVTAEQPAAESTETVQQQPAQQQVTAQAGQRIEAILQTLAAAGTVPTELRDPAFDYYVDLPLLGNAWVELDAALMTDLALQFMEGERVLLRSHRAIESSDLLEIAIRLAAVKADHETLERLDKAVQRSDNNDLAAELAKQQKLLDEADGDAAWTVSVATTSAADFARYKSVLQDIEAAIVVGDGATLETVQQELERMFDLPEAHRAKLNRKIEDGLARFTAEEQTVSRAAQVLDKLAYSTRTGPRPETLNPGSALLQLFGSGATPGVTPGPTPGGGSSGGGTPPMLGGMIHTVRPVVVTECPATPTECVFVQTQCGTITNCSGSNETQCPAVFTRCPTRHTQCPPGTTYCPPGSCENPTQNPQMQTECPTVYTRCPTQSTYCPPGTCNGPTQNPQVPTECHSVQTECPTVKTSCPPGEGCERPTLYPSVPTQCPAIRTSCPPSLTFCPTCAPPQQQQQQKQRWIPSKGKYDYGGGQSQQDFGQSAYGTPYRRRAAYYPNP